MRKNNPYGLIGDIVEIKWRDSQLYITQCSRDEKIEIAIITSIGQLIDVTDDAVIIAGDLLENGDMRRVIAIPKENIILDENA